MSILKIGESLHINQENFISSNSIKADDEIHNKFLKLATKLKKIAPKADDFLYFTAIMMHAAERSAYNEDGVLKKDRNGVDVKISWEINEKTGSWKWVSSDPTIQPYRNCNRDIFPEAELKKAYKQWIGKPLCKDHQSSSVDGMRGLIIDTYWDNKNKRIIALCALDKISYPELARHVKTGVAGDVSMGTAVSHSICSECGNVAATENEYCIHVRNKTAYGEINVGLNPIELSIVMNGADKKAKVLEVLAAVKEIQEKASASNVEDNMQEILSKYKKLSFKVEELEQEILNAKNNNNNFALKRIANLNIDESDNYLSSIKQKLSNLEDILTSIYKDSKKLSTEELMANNIKKGYWLGTEEPKPKQKQYDAEDADSIRNTQDSHMKGQLTDLSPAAGTEIPKQDLDLKKQVARASIEERRAIRAAALERAQNSLKKDSDKKAYMLGTEEPKTYPVDPLAEKARKEDKQLQNPNVSGVYPEDAKLKEKLHRASLKARLITAANASDNRWEVFEKVSNKMIFVASFKELAGKKIALYKPLYEKNFGRHLMSTIKTVGLNKANELFKSAQEAPEPVMEPVEEPVGDPMGDLTPMEESVTEPVVELETGLAEPPPGDMEMEGTQEGKAKAALNSVVEGLKGLSDVLETALPSMEQAVEAMESESGDFEAVEQPEMAVEEALTELTEPVEPPTVASLNKLRMVLNAGLKKAFTDSIKPLEICKEEISLLKSAANSNCVDVGLLTNLAKEAMKDAKKAIKDSEILRMAFVKYVKSIYVIDKKAELERNLEKKAQMEVEDYELTDDEVTIEPVPDLSETTDVKPWEYDLDELELDATAQLEKEFNMKTAEGRKSARHKLAASVGSKLQFSEMLQKAHPKGGTKLEGISDTKENVVEDIREVHTKMQESVSHEPKVKKAAEKLNNLIKAGKIEASNLDSLVKEGLDSEVVSYWKKYYSQVSDGSEFAAALLKDYSGSVSKEKKAEMEEDLKAKTIRAFELAYQMADVGLCSKTQPAIKKEAERILSYDDNAYASVKRVVNHHAKISKSAVSNSVQVGVAFDSNDSYESDSQDLQSQLLLAFSDR